MSTSTSTFIDKKTYDAFYNRAFKYYIELLDPTETTRLFVSDGFNPPASNLVVEQIEINQAQWDTWTASIRLDDSIFNNIDPDVFDNGMVMKIKFGKSFGDSVNAFYGIVDSVGPTRKGLNKLSWEAQAKGFGVVPNYTYTDFQKAPPPETLSTGAVISNPSSIPFFANNLIKTFFQDANVMPLLDYTLEQRMGPNFSLEFVSDAVTDFIPGIKSPLATASTLINIVARMSGAIWYVDQNKKLQFRYPYGDNQGVIIKDYPEDNDSGDYVSYIHPSSSFSYQDSTRPEDGFAQQLFAVAEETNQIGMNTTAISFTSLADKNLAFAVIPGVTKFNNMTFIMSKVGAGTSEANPAIAKVRGMIVTDNELSPTGTVIANFSIPVASITDTPQPVIKIDRPTFRDIQIDKLHWIIFFGSGSSDDNTVRLWHDDDRTTASTPDNPRYTAMQFHRNGIDNKKYLKRDWFVSAQGPKYSIAFATTNNMLVEASDPSSIEKWSPGRPVQARVTIPSLKNIQATQQYLQILVSQTAQKIRNYGNLKVSIPNILIEPGTEVQLVSDKIRDLYFDNNRVATVKSVSYSLDVQDYAIGSKHCEVALRGYVSPF